MRITIWLAAGATLAALTGPALATDEAGFRAGIEVSGRVTPESMGLVRYPGAAERPATGGEREALKLGLHGGAFGFDLRVLKLYSVDPVAEVARFYREALALHGPVLDCSRGQPPAPTAPADMPATDTALSCDRDGPVDGAFVYKVGQRRNFRAVAVDEVQGQTRIQLVRMRWKNG